MDTGKIFTGPGPRGGDLLDSAILIGALDARHPGSQIGFVLKEVEMSPRLLGGVMNGSGGPTDRAGKLGATRKIDLNVKPLALLGKLDTKDFLGLPFTHKRGSSTLVFLHQ